MRRAFSLALSSASIFALSLSLPGCGGGSSNQPASGLSQRAFVANQNPNVGLAGLEIADASKDQLSSKTVSLGGSSPALMIPGANNTTLVFNAGDNGLSVVDNIKEALVGNEISLPGATESMAASSDGKFAYVAVPRLSEVGVVPLTASTIAVTTIPANPNNCAATSNCLPGANRIVLSHNNAKLLVFNEALDQFEIINTSDSTVKTITGSSLDRPAYGVFSADDSKAYILNCGAECGGKQASVTVLDTSALTLSTPVPVDGASIGIADSTNLYVAGSNPATPGAGSATILPLASLTGGKQVKIGDGFHQVMSIFQNKLFIGARLCSTGCLSELDIAGATAIVDAPKGDVTAIAPITPRTVVYVTEGGELRIYDVSNLNEHLVNNTPQIDIVGKTSSVLYVGPKT